MLSMVHGLAEPRKRAKVKNAFFCTFFENFSLCEQEIMRLSGHKIFIFSCLAR